MDIFFGKLIPIEQMQKVAAFQARIGARRDLRPIGFTIGWTFVGILWCPRRRRPNAWKLFPLPRCQYSAGPYAPGPQCPRDATHIAPRVAPRPPVHVHRARSRGLEAAREPALPRLRHAAVRRAPPHERAHHSALPHRLPLPRGALAMADSFLAQHNRCWCRRYYVPKCCGRYLEDPAGKLVHTITVCYGTNERGEVYTLSHDCVGSDCWCRYTLADSLQSKLVISPETLAQYEKWVEGHQRIIEMTKPNPLAIPFIVMPET